METIEIKEIKNKLDEIDSAINKLSSARRELEKTLKDEYLKLGKIEGLASYIKYKGYPCELYDCFGTDPGEFDSFGDIKIKVVYYYGYTDIRGLTDDEFIKLTNLINK